MTTSKWLSPIERRLAQRRMEEDFAGIGDEGQTEKGSAAGFVSAVNDWKVWWLAFTLASMVVSLSFNAFFPTLSATMGFNRTVTLLLCAPVRYDTLIHLGDFSSLKFLCSCIAMDFCNFGRVGCNKVCLFRCMLDRSERYPSIGILKNAGNDFGISHFFSLW